MLKHLIRRPWFAGVLMLALVALASMPASAQRLAGLSPDLYKSGQRTRDAFKPIVAAAREATVQVQCDGADRVLGAIVDAEGYVMTKASDLSGEITVQLRDGTKLPATIVGVHRDTDLAMLKIDAKDLKVVEWASDADPSVGQWVATVGRAEAPIAVGVVSTPRRPIPRLGGVLGVRIGEVDKGVTIDEIYAGSGAEQAGLAVGDIILSVNDHAVKTMQELQGIVRGHDPGHVLSVTFERKGETMQKSVTLGSRTEMLARIDRNARQQQLGGALSKRTSGFPAVLQHDTVLRPQDVGGPLVDLDGKVVALNIARAGRVETYAIPAAEVRKLIGPMKAGKFKPQEEEAKAEPKSDAKAESKEEAKTEPKEKASQ